MGCAGVRRRRSWPGTLCRPFVIEQRIPGGVTVATFVNDGLAEGAFVGEAEAFGGAAAGRVQAVAFPFVAAVVQFVKDVVHQQVLGFGGKARAFEGVAIADPAHFDDAVGRVDAHQRQGAQRGTARGVADGEVVGVIGCGHALHVGIMHGAVGRRVNAEVGEVGRRRGGAIDGVKVVAVAGRIKFFEAAVAAMQGGDGRTCAGGVTGQGVADGLVMGGHDLSGDSLEDGEVTGHGVEPPPLPAGYFLHDVSFFKFAQQAASSRGADIQPFFYGLYGLYWRGIE